MAMNLPGDQNNPLNGLLGDLLKILGGTGATGSPWLDSARALAHGVALDGAVEANPDPVERMRLEEIVRIGDLHVTELTGIVAHGPVLPVPVGRGTYATKVLDAWAPWLNQMVSAQGTLPQLPFSEGATSGIGGEGGLDGLLAQFATTMGPMFLGLQFGSAAGHLSHRALGQFALPLPWPISNELLFVPVNIATFAEDWSLAAEDVTMFVALRELVAHRVFSIAGVRAALDTLLTAATAESMAVQRTLLEHLGDGSSPEALSELMADPEALIADLVTPGQRAVSDRLTAITTALAAYVDHIAHLAGVRVLGNAGPLFEAWYRYRVGEGKGEQAAGALFGIDLSRAEVDRGQTFVDGIIEREGEAGLARLFEHEANLPTPAEIAAPGLWLERIAISNEEG